MYANSSPSHGEIYLKNIGTNRISLDEISRSDVFFGKSGYFSKLSYTSGDTINSGQWGYDFSEGSYDTNSNQIWEIGETIKIITVPTGTFLSNDPVYFQFILPNSVGRSTEFTVS